ncbi:Non-race specific disease resistance protein 1-like protein b, putative [Theobroma cacao]|uniref:Non-race specific disease resistance protein 1-like protein b, putative n=1 Tax=Theobroma cacao TaxID=3641 RepID=A0A061FDK0_THECC|nr:Non-race specific disease resistance protein 1-like protein b, putative [Theobroma cacao]
MADSGGGCCRCCCSFIFTLGLTALFMWLSLRTSNPKCSIKLLYLPSLNKTLNLSTDPTLNFTLGLDNPNKDKGIKYDPVNVTVYDFPNRSHVIGGGVIQGFYQGHKKKATKQSQGTANTTVALRAVSENGTGVFRVDMSTAVKFKIIFWYTKKHKIRVGADVLVNASGVKVYPKGIRLKSMAPKMGSFCVLVGALVNFLVFTLLSFCGKH